MSELSFRQPRVLGALAVIFALSALLAMHAYEGRSTPMPPPPPPPPVDPAPWQPPKASEVPLQTLEVLGIGLVFERLGGHEVWKRAQASGGRKVISDDDNDYERDPAISLLQIPELGGAAVGGAIGRFVEGWSIPYIFATSDIKDEAARQRTTNYDIGNNYRRYASLHWHRMVKVGQVFTDRMSSALEAAFRFFEENPDAPVVMIYGKAGGDRSPGNTIDNFTGVDVALLLGRSERLAWLRNYTKYVKKPDGTTYPRFSEWIAEPPVPFTPTKFFPEPWTAEQFAQFDKLAVRALLHRPIHVGYRKNAQGEPLLPEAAGFDKAKAMKEPEKHAAFAEAWAQAMAALGGGEAWRTDRSAGPARIFFDHGKPGTGGHLIPVTQLLMHAPDAQAARYDLLDPAFGFNTFNVLGNMRTPYPIAQWALAAIAVEEQKRPMVTLDLRSPDVATITVLTPGRASGATPTR